MGYQNLTVEYEGHVAHIKLNRPEHLNALCSVLDQSIMHMDSDQFILSTTSEDHQEALQAFFEKRKPEFRGN